MSSECDGLLPSVHGAHDCPNMRDYEKIKDSLHLGPSTSLHPHQQLALQWIISREHTNGELKGGVLADGPGLGKTLTMLSVIQHGASKCPTLVVVPNQIIAEQWMKDMETHFLPNTWAASIFSTTEPIDPSHHIVLILMKDLTKEWHRRQSELSERGRSVSTLYHVSWSRICVDEVQEILGKSSLAAQMIQQLEAPIRWGLSGTPVSKLVDIQGLAQFLQLAPYDSSHWWRTHGTSALSLVRPVLSKIVWRTRSQYVIKSLKLPSQTILPTTYIPMSAIEFAAYRPHFEKYIKDVRKRIASFEGNDQVIALSELRQILNHPAVLSLCKGASHVSFLTKLKPHSPHFVAQMVTRQRDQCSSALAQYIEACLPFPHQLQIAYKMWREHKDELSTPWLVQLKMFSALATYTRNSVKPQIRYRHEVHRTILDTRTSRLPAILWQRVFEFLVEDFSTQMHHLLQEHQAPLKAVFDNMAAAFWSESSPDSLEDFQREVIASYQLEMRLPRPPMQALLNEFMDMRLSEARTRVGIFERPTLWHYLRNKKSGTVDSGEIRMVTTDLLSQYIEQHNASLKLLHDLMHANWKNLLPQVLEGYGRCNHATRRMDRTLVVGREERWQRRDQQHSQGRGQLTLGTRCVVCTLRNRIDMAMSFLVTEGKTPTLMLLFFTTDAPMKIQAMLNQSTANLQQMLSLATLLDNWLRISLDIQTCMSTALHDFSATPYRRIDLALEKFQQANCYRNFTNAIAALDSSETVQCDECHQTTLRSDVRLMLCCHRFCIGCCTSQRQCRLCSKELPFPMTKAPPLPPHLLVWGSKMDVILQDIKSIAPREKCVVFSQYPEVLDLLVQQLSDVPLECIQLKSGNQVDLRRQFQTQSNLRVLLLPLKKYNHGLNLVEATHVFLLEPSLQPALHDQAMARVKRLNQPHPTFVHRYVMRDTVEEAVESVLSQHRRLTKQDIFRIFAQDVFEAEEAPPL
ncbi:hypothetical protein Ae201684P_006304 [Aphanomyces euteiches]|uniref:Helicase ATP-binding domain-containing protein n=1 Tax=Aphanomyces euteiches TaxID=100861 RepID=A0A6G0XBF9_9STRA|nr:hypothetical protein Ae201684_006613 [Aphanomyces euteiches]KAH9090900.1 hypothetical protein Ae201684P_006304 [Aphanomyces euteiches]KAH9136403.1 hypothetical protein AeRB84_018415 [Aphanomyces euteiches]